MQARGTAVLHRRFIVRQITSAPRQSVLFVLCVALSLVSLVALGGFSESVHRSMLRDARQLHAGDVMVRSHYEFSPGLSRAVAEFVRQGAVEAARVWEFLSMVRGAGETAPLLAGLKVVEKGYPFYGAVLLESGKPLAEVLVPGAAVVGKTLLDRLDLRVGDRLQVGQARLIIRDVVLQEPDRPLDFFALGPRVLIAAEDLASLDLVKPGSRVHYSLLLRVPDERSVDRIAASLRSRAKEPEERVATSRTAESGVKRFLDNFLMFLGFIGVFTLLLAGIGIETVLTAFLRERERTLGIVKALGATSRFVTVHHLAVVSLLGLAGTLLGIAWSFGLQVLLPALFRGLLPPTVDLSISWKTVAEGFALGLVVVALFTIGPLRLLRNVKPNAIFRKDEVRPARSGTSAFVAATAVLAGAGMILWRLRDLKTSLAFVLGTLLLVILAALITEAALAGLRRYPARSLALRQALRGLFRPRSATRPLIITLAVSLAILFSIYLLEENLDATFVRSYPPDAPNLFFLDIQPSQREAFAALLGEPAEFYPVVRARVAAINGRPVEPEKERRRRGDNLGREFALTYRNRLLDDEVIAQGRSLYGPRGEGARVSVLDSVLEMADIALGDVIAFDVQGVPLEARVASIRTRTRRTIRPFFYFLFPEETLKEAPQTIFTAVRVDSARAARLQAAIAAAFPNVTAIDASETIAIFARVMQQLSSIVRFFALFGVGAGLLLIVSSIFATRFARIQEAVYFKVLGADRRFIATVFALEHLIIGFLGASLALGMSQAASWIISRRLLDIPYTAFPAASLLMVALTALVVMGVGLATSLSILGQRPVAFLREQADE
jgi:putative ABC transport system permease protein